MKCPHAPIECAYLDTSGMDSTKHCEKCEHYPNPIDRLCKAFTVEHMLNMLPKSIIKGKKSLFRSHEIFDLMITKDALDNWHVIYMNDMRLHVLYEILNQDIHRGLAEIMIILIENKYLQPCEKSLD